MGHVGFLVPGRLQPSSQPMFAKDGTVLENMREEKKHHGHLRVQEGEEKTKELKHPTNLRGGREVKEMRVWEEQETAQLGPINIKNFNNKEPYGMI